MQSTDTIKRSSDETRTIMIRILLLAFILFFNSISTAYQDTFLPEIMVSFNVAKSTSDSGKYAAWLNAGFFFGRFISASLWGSFIDKYGRKSGLLIVLTLIIIATFLFGLSTNYYYALVIRSLTGLVNGLSIIGKTLSTEICPDDLKPWSISMTNTIWSLGITMGPFLGSLFYNKTATFPILFSSLAVCALGSLLLILSYIYIEETLVVINNLKPTNISYKLQTQKDDSDINSANKFKPTEKSDIDADKDYETTNIPKISNEVFQEQSGNILAIPNILKLIFIFSFNTFYAAVLVGLIPFWIASKYEDGGLNFQYNDISDVFLYLTPPQLILQIFLYPIIQKKRGDFWLLTRGHYAHLPIFFFLPFAHLFGKGSLNSQKLWIVFWLFVRNTASFMNFAALQRFTNDAIAPNKRGKMNGIQVTFSSLFQIAGPFIGGWLLSWSETNHLDFPFDYHFVFLLMCLFTIGVIGVIYRLTFVDGTKSKLITNSFK